MELKDVKGIGIKYLSMLNEININTIDDLILTFPKKYYIYELTEDDIFSGENVTIKGILLSNPAFIKYNFRVNAIIFYIVKQNIKIKCILFSNDYLKFKLFKGTQVIINGKYNKDSKEFFVRKIFLEDFTSFVEVDYKLSSINNSFISRSIKNVLINNYTCCESIPEELVNKYKLLPISEYIYYSHFPRNKNDVHQIMRRRKYEEFFWYAIKLELLKTRRANSKRKAISLDDSIINEFYKLIDYEPTLDQKKAIIDVFNDLKIDYPMNRLIQGDVGSGKTLVLLACSYFVVKANRCVAIMVPTEILAYQEYEELKKVFSSCGFVMEILTSSTKQKEKNDILYRLMHSRIDIIVGTHSLLEDNVVFNNLGCVIIDEEHKFGVNQREKLINKLKNIDVLYLSATPIPRTLGLSNFGDLDISSIKMKPKGRKEVITKIINNDNFLKLIKSIDNIIERHEQIYVVVPVVEENTGLNVISVSECYKKYQELLPNRRISMLHGKMKNEEKKTIMDDFIKGNIDILISTTVIEVGVNVLNASMIVIMNAERFGLSQLHQLRGRVARSSLNGACALVSEDINNPRLNALVNTFDGFEISEIDFKLRGPGDYFGVIQSGYMDFEYASLEADLNIWNCAKMDAKDYLPKLIDNHINNDKFKKIIKTFYDNK